MPPKTLPRVLLRDEQSRSIHVLQNLYSLPTQQAKAKTLQYGVRVLHEYEWVRLVGTKKDKCILAFLQNSWHNRLFHFIMPITSSSHRPCLPVKAEPLHPKAQQVLFVPLLPSVPDA